MIKVINNDCLKVLDNLPDNSIIVTDPPFNIGCHYKSYKDRLKEDEYYEMLKKVFYNRPFVIIHYPEAIYKLALRLNRVPIRVVSWVYNSNTPRQHRDIAFFGVEPDFSKVKQPYKNPTDKRIKDRIARGITGGKLYDWWNVNQVKNVSKKGVDHPCVMPVEVMKNIIGVLPNDVTIVDPFAGTGTTLLACQELNRDCIGIEINKDYCDIINERLLIDNIKGGNK